MKIRKIFKPAVKGVVVQKAIEASKQLHQDLTQATPEELDAIKAQRNATARYHQDVANANFKTSLRGLFEEAFSKIDINATYLKK